jgi:hypothetical protein
LVFGKNNSLFIWWYAFCAVSCTPKTGKTNTDNDMYNRDYDGSWEYRGSEPNIPASVDIEVTEDYEDIDNSDGSFSDVADEI